MLKKVWTLAFAALLIVGAGSLAQADPPTDDPNCTIDGTVCDSDASGDLTCEEARCCFQQQLLLNDSAMCTGAGNHGQFVSCAAHLIKQLVEAGMPTNCKGKLQRCAARSVCGKQSRDFHTCTITDQGTCVTGDTLTGATCDNTGDVCATNADCVTSRCKTMRGTERCAEAGGALDLAPTCCSTCATAAP